MAEGRIHEIVCRNCKKQIFYAPIQVPVEPVHWRKHEAATNELPMYQAEVAYTQVCLPCARLLLGMIDERELSAGRAFWTKDVPLTPTRPGFFLSLKKWTCPECFRSFPALGRVQKTRPWFSCPGCCVPIRIQK